MVPIQGKNRIKVRKSIVLIQGENRIKVQKNHKCHPRPDIAAKVPSSHGISSSLYLVGIASNTARPSYHVFKPILSAIIKSSSLFFFADRGGGVSWGNRSIHSSRRCVGGRLDVGEQPGWADWDECVYSRGQALQSSGYWPSQPFPLSHWRCWTRGEDGCYRLRHCQ